MRLTAILTCLVLAAGCPLTHAATDTTRTDASAAVKETPASMSAAETAAASRNCQTEASSIPGASSSTWCRPS
jgi:hypothetical protein